MVPFRTFIKSQSYINILIAISIVARSGRLGQNWTIIDHFYKWLGILPMMLTNW